MTALTITSRYIATGPVLEVHGGLDHESAPDLRKAVDGLTLAPGHLLVMDLAALDFCDSSGIAVLLAARNLAGEQGADIALAAVPANTARILAIVGLDRVFTLHPDTSAARSARRSRPRNHAAPLPPHIGTSSSVGRRSRRRPRQAVLRLAEEEDDPHRGLPLSVAEELKDIPHHRSPLVTMLLH
ncbi:STAS domain-containing protein [Streptomyces griseus]|uniref:STAS domain-containing protein n=1 Tax=Streptomyces griseus TaxID=1911 RepID=UPI003787DAC6